MTLLWPSIDYDFKKTCFFLFVVFICFYLFIGWFGFWFGLVWFGLVWFGLPPTSGQSCSLKCGPCPSGPTQCMPAPTFRPSLWVCC
jgi:hypothetical protein